MELRRILKNGYRDITAFDNEVVFIYSDLRAFGIYANDYSTRDAFLYELIEPFLSNGQTVIIPTFTYTGTGRFDVDRTPSRLGALNKWVTRQQGALRSEHPLFSVAAIGARADIVRNVGKSAFGGDSIFERLLGQNAAFLHIGRPVAIGNTCVHYVEQKCGATYRYHKAFDTDVFRGDEFIGKDYTAFVRRQDIPDHDFEFSYKNASTLDENLNIRETGVPDKFTNLSLYAYDTAISYFTDSFYNDQSCFIKKEFISYV